MLSLIQRILLTKYEKAHAMLSQLNTFLHFIISETMLVVLAPSDVLRLGLMLLGFELERMSEESGTLQFHMHYGSSPLDLADMWYDLTVGDHIPAELQLSIKEKSEKGFKRFLMTHFWLWAYPKNASMLASRFMICKRYCRGEHIFKWIMRVAALKAKKIVWDADSRGMDIFAFSHDGTDFKLQEQKHPVKNRDNTACSQKMNHGAAKYEVALSVFRPKCVHIAGPFKGGVHDKTMFWKGGLKEKLKHLNREVRGTRRVKLTLVDRGYHTDWKDEQGLFSYPNNFDSKELDNFKSRGRLRHETFNGRLKFFSCLSETFRHGFDKHKFVFEAVVVIVQYQMDNGSPIYAV